MPTAAAFRHTSAADRTGRHARRVEAAGPSAAGFLEVRDVETAIERDTHGKPTGFVRVVLTARNGTELLLRMSDGRASVLAASLDVANDTAEVRRKQVQAHRRPRVERSALKVVDFREDSTQWRAEAWRLYRDTPRTLAEVAKCVRKSYCVVREELKAAHAEEYNQIARRKRSDGHLGGSAQKKTLEN